MLLIHEQNLISNMVTLKVGDKAPDFSAPDQNGKIWTLSEMRGKKTVLVFYSEDGSPTCTIQACNLRDNYDALMKAGFQLLTISPDTAKKHKKFEAKFQLPFIMLTDPEHHVLDKYGIWDEKELFGRRYMGVLRTTFVIDEKGIIIRVFHTPKNKAHVQEILESFKEE
jgi:peroxiredoxin Q/BCP